MGKPPGNDYDLCLIRRGEIDASVFAASLLDYHPAVHLEQGEIKLDVYDVLSGQVVKVEYLADAGVKLSGDSSSSHETVSDAIQGIPPRGFQVLASNGAELRPPTVISTQRNWILQRCQIRLEHDINQNAGVQILIRHAEAFDLAIGGLPGGVPVPRRSVGSVAEQYRRDVAQFDLRSGHVLPFNNSSAVRGFVVLGDSTDGLEYECDCFSRSPLTKGSVLIRSATYSDRRSGRKVSYQSRVGEVTAVSHPLGTGRLD